MPCQQSSAPARAVADTALRWVVALTALNLLFNLAAMRAGAAVPYRLFLYDLAERFDDYFTFILSWPAPGRAEPGLFFADRVAAAIRANPFGGLDALEQGRLTHLFVPPLTAVFCLASAGAMRVVDPAILFVATLAGLAFYWCRIAVRTGRDGDRAATVVLGLVSYPMLTMATRGNVYAGATAMLVIDALLLAAARCSPARSGLLLAAAVNIRPNAILFALPLLILQRDRVRAGTALAGGGALLFLGSLGVAHALDPDYSLSSFVRALGRYYDWYVVGDAGLAYGSSLFGATKLMFGYQPWADRASLAVALGLLAGAAWLHAVRPLPPASWLFLTVSAYALGSTVFTDYHLLTFLLVPAVLAATPGDGTPARRAMLLTSCLLLAPKNYIFYDRVSLQVLLNPVLMLLGSGTVLAAEARERLGLPGPRPVLA